MIDLIAEVLSAIQPGPDCFRLGSCLWRNPRVGALRQYGADLLPVAEYVLATVAVPPDGGKPHSRGLWLGIGGLVDLYIEIADAHHWNMAAFLRDVQTPVYQQAASHIGVLWASNTFSRRTAMPRSLYDVLVARQSDYSRSGALLAALDRYIRVGMLTFDDAAPGRSIYVDPESMTLVRVDRIVSDARALLRDSTGE